MTNFKRWLNKRMNEEIDRLNNKLEEKKQNETESEKEKT